METKFDTRYICPFCGYDGEFRLFLTVGKNGYSRKKFKCPDCNQIMKKETLIREMSVEEWAKWLYASVRVFSNHKQPELAFYNRISWEKLSTRLKFYGIANEFWESWKETKTFSTQALETLVYNIPTKKKTKQSKL